MADEFDQYLVKEKSAPAGDEFDQYLVKPEGPPQTEEQGFVSKTISNIPKSGYEFGKGMVSAIIHPAQTIENIVGLPKGLGMYIDKKLGRKLTPEQEFYAEKAETVGNFYADRYGGWENLKKTISEDPVGFAADLSVVAGGTGAALKAGGLTKAASVAGKVSQITNPAAWPGEIVGGVRKTVGATKIPESLYARTMKIPPGSLRIEDRESIINTLVRKEKLGLDAGTRDKLNNIIGEIESEIKPALERISQKGAELNMQMVYTELDKLKSRFANRSDAKHAFGLIDEVKRDYMEHDFVTKTLASPLKERTNPLFKEAEPWKETKPEVLSREAFLDKAQEMKKGLYGQLETYYKKGAMPETGRVGIKNDIEAAGMAKVASTLREGILSHPDTPAWMKTKLEREAGAMMARKWVERAANRGGNLDPMSLGAMAFGIASEGGIPAATAYKIATSQSILSRLALLIAHGSKTTQGIGKVARPASLGTAQAGRISQLTPQMEE